MIGRKNSIETRKLISESNKGRVVKEETRYKISESNKKPRGPMSEEHKDKIRKSKIGITISHKGKPWSEARRNAYNKRKEIC